MLLDRGCQGTRGRHEGAASGWAVFLACLKEESSVLGIPETLVDRKKQLFANPALLEWTERLRAGAYQFLTVLEVMLPLLPGPAAPFFLAA